MKRTTAFTVTAVLLLLGLGLGYRIGFRPGLKEGLSLSQGVYDCRGNLLRITLSRDEKYRLWVPLTKISPLLVKATLLHEDRWFFYHPGINPGALLRAFWHTYVKADRRIGGSTITMQVARMRYMITSRTLSGKLRQICRALYLECFYSKREILEAYLNLAPYGLNIEGAAAASQIYFDKSPLNLNLPEALTLSVIPQSPIRRIGASGGTESEQKNRNLMKARAALFAKWSATYPADREQKHLLELPFQLRTPATLPFLAPHFVQEVLDSDPFDSQITTTLDLKLQKLLERHVRGYVEDKRHIGINNASSLLLDYRTMEVKALLGSADFFNAAIQGQVDGTLAKRSPGSTVKPFIYALAIDQGLIHPLSILKDTALSFAGYNPENFDGEFAGPLNATEALIKSRNVPAVKLCSRLGDGGLHRFLFRAGVSKLKEPSHYGMTLALGSAETSMQELVELYAILAGGGVARPLKTRPAQKTEPGPRLLSREACALVMSMLATNPRPFQGYQQAWTRDNISVAWKTGTSYGYRDAWSVGIFGPYVLAVWVGNFSGEGNPAFVGREAAGPLFFQLVDSLRSACPEVSMRQYSRPPDLNIVKVNVCAVSGMIPGPYCSHRIPTSFIPGKSPIKVCDIHRLISIDSTTGLRACLDGAPGTRPVVYECWSSDMLAIFRQAGIPRMVPPPYDPECGLQARAGKRATGLTITSPQKDVTYTLRAANLLQEKIPFTAVSDANARVVHWFIDAHYIGASASGQTLLWTPSPGTFMVRAVDDQGHSARRVLRALIVQ